MNSEVEFQYTVPERSDQEYRRQRFFEVVPGAVSWSLLGGIVVLSYLRPVWALVLLLLLDWFWLSYLVYTLVLLVLSSARLAMERDTDWMARIRALDKLAEAGASAKGPRRASLGGRLSECLARRELRKLKRAGAAVPASRDVYHVVIVPILDEERPLLERGLHGLLGQTFPSERTIVILAVEEGATRRVKQGTWDLHREYFEKFFGIYVAAHHAGVEGANGSDRASMVSCAARMATRALREREIPLDHAIVTCLDPRAELGSDYLACVAWHFLVCPRRHRTSFQPISVYHRNVWEVPALARVLNVSASFFHLIEASAPEKLVTFSSHSMSCRTLDEVGYWPLGMLSDDASIYWKCYLRYEGDYGIRSMPLALWLDIPHEGSFRSAAGGLYRNRKRWAWGIENFPVIMRGFLSAPGIPLLRKVRHGCRLLLTHVAWATWSPLILVIGWLPALFSTLRFPASNLPYYAVRVQALAFGLALAALCVAAGLSLFHLDLRGLKNPVRRIAGYLLSWLLLPVFAILHGSLPALDVQTRMLRGRHPRQGEEAGSG